jgi:hypothetical protein
LMGALGRRTTPADTARAPCRGRRRQRTRHDSGRPERWHARQLYLLPIVFVQVAVPTAVVVGVVVRMVGAVVVVVVVVAVVVPTVRLVPFAVAGGVLAVRNDAALLVLGQWAVVLVLGCVRVNDGRDGRVQAPCTGFTVPGYLLSRPRAGPVHAPRDRVLLDRVLATCLIHRTTSAGPG